MDNRHPKMPVQETDGQFNNRVFGQTQKLSRASQGKISLLAKMCEEVSRNESLLEADKRTTIVAHLRFHLKTYRAVIGRIERSLMIIAGADNPHAKFSPAKKRPATALSAVRAELKGEQRGKNRS